MILSAFSSYVIHTHVKFVPKLTLGRKIFVKRGSSHAIESRRDELLGRKYGNSKATLLKKSVPSKSAKKAGKGVLTGPDESNVCGDNLLLIHASWEIQHVGLVLLDLVHDQAENNPLFRFLRLHLE